MNDEIKVLLSDGRIVTFIWCDLFNKLNITFANGWYYKGTKHVYRLFFNESKDNQIELKVLFRRNFKYTWEKPKKFRPIEFMSIYGSYKWH